MTYINPNFIIAEFLRTFITDPAGRDSSRTENLSATASQTSFTITPSSNKRLQAITAVSVDGTTKSKYVDYYVDIKTPAIVFFDGSIFSGGEDVEITYKEASKSWIVTNKPTTDTNASDFPIISVKKISGSGIRQGNYEAPMQSDNTFQIDVWTKEPGDGVTHIHTINSKNYAGLPLAQILAYETKKVFRQNEDELHPQYYNYEQSSEPNDLPFDEDLQVYRYTQDVTLLGINTGEVE